VHAWVCIYNARVCVQVSYHDQSTFSRIMPLTLLCMSNICTVLTTHDILSVKLPAGVRRWNITKDTVGRWPCLTIHHDDTNRYSKGFTHIFQHLINIILCTNWFTNAIFLCYKLVCQVYIVGGAFYELGVYLTWVFHMPLRMRTNASLRGFFINKNFRDQFTETTMIYGCINLQCSKDNLAFTVLSLPH
jgi:hypothetical protein